jgi:DNA invertase Pin-like site-specific DNA recombinase
LVLCCAAAASGHVTAPHTTLRKARRRARANGTKLGRRRVDPAVEARILELKASGDGILKIGRKLGIGTSVVQRVFKQEPRPS